MIKKIIIDDDFYKISKERLIFTGFILYFISQFYYATMFEFPLRLVQLVKYLGLFLICVKIFAFDKYTNKKWLLLFALVCSFIISAYLSTNKTLLEYVIIVMGFKDINYKKIINVFLNMCAILLIITIISCKLGLIDNVTITRKGGFIRESWGMVYPTDFAAALFYLFAAFLCVNDSIERKGTIILFIGLLALYKVTDARLDCVSIILLYIIFKVLSKIDESVFQRKYIKYPLIFMFVLCSIVIIVLTVKYNPNNKVLNKINAILSNRLIYGKDMVNKHGIKLFGQELMEFGWGGNTENKESFEYAFIDSSYIKLLVKYGVISYFVVCYFTIRLSCQLYNRKMYKMLLILTIILINSMIAQHYTEIAYNFMIPLVLCDFSNPDQMKLKEKNG